MELSQNAIEYLALRGFAAQLQSVVTRVVHAASEAVGPELRGQGVALTVDESALASSVLPVTPATVAALLAAREITRACSACGAANAYHPELCPVACGTCSQAFVPAPA
jgi:hypothetical protein